MTNDTIRWARRNLFLSPLDSVLSIIVIPLLLWAVYAFAVWVFVTADWDVLASSMRVLMVGIFPADQLWRAWVAALLLSASFGAGMGLSVKVRARAFAALMAAAAVAGVLVAAGVGPAGGGGFALCAWTGLILWKIVDRWPRAKRLVGPGILVALVLLLVVLVPPGFKVWGGLMLSVVLTLITSVLTFPLGVLLAFGRQSRIMSLRVICTAYIEVMRSIPLILVVYWIWIVLPLLVHGTSLPSLLRGMIGYTMFFAAYVAEYVRSGLQAVPRGQVEAAQSLGMSPWNINTDVVLPQALRVVVPALVDQILDIFNNATLVFIIGLTDFLRAGEMILANPQNSGRTYEVYVFLFAVYMAIGGAITYASRQLEARLARGSR